MLVESLPEGMALREGQIVFDPERYDMLGKVSATYKDPSGVNIGGRGSRPPTRRAGSVPKRKRIRASFSFGDAERAFRCVTLARTFFTSQNDARCSLLCTTSRTSLALCALLGKNGVFASICTGDLTDGLTQALTKFDQACKDFPSGPVK